VDGSNTFTITMSLTAVPEPSTFLLVALACMIALTVRRPRPR